MTMTIDMENFEMTLEVLGSAEDANRFFQTYENEARKDLHEMRRCVELRDWPTLARICHTWKGRNSQIGFRRSTFIATSLHDFLLQLPPKCSQNDEKNHELIDRQVAIFFDTLERECENITKFLKSHSLI